VVENEKSLKNIKYYQGDMIIINFPGSQDRFADQISDMTDSSVIFILAGEVNLADISCVYRENWLIQTLRGLSLLGGAAYFGLDTFNRMINHDNPVVLTETLIISGSMIAFSFALIPFRYRKIHPGEKWHLRTIDLGEF
jgi:hypothetical protein